jgi:transcriptional regulator with XRE-family HTH domain
LQIHKTKKFFRFYTFFPQIGRKITQEEEILPICILTVGILLYKSNKKIMYNSRIKQNIRQCRTEKGYTQGQMAEKLGVDDRTYKLIESEKGTRMFYERIDDIARILEVPIDALFYGNQLSEEGAASYGAESSSMLKEDRSAMEQELANLHLELCEKEQMIKALQQEVARLSGCIDDKDYIIRLLKADLLKYEQTYSASK